MVRYRKRAEAHEGQTAANREPDYAAAITALTAKIAALETGFEKNSQSHDAEREDITFGEWSERWFATYKAQKAYNTRKQYRRMLDAYILPVLGGLRLRDAKPFHIQEAVNGLSDKGLTATAKMAVMTIRQILAAAVMNGLVDKNAAERVELPKARRKTRDALNKENRSLVLGLANDGEGLKYKAFLYTLFYTGIRRGEILALVRGDVDMDGRKIHIGKTVIFAPNAAVIKDSPKSAAGIRDVPIADKLAAVLADYLPTTGEVVFPDSRGGYMSLSAFRAFWKRLIDWAGLPSTVTAHSLRHNFVTELFYAGVDAKDAQRLAGHAKINTTLETYTHLREDAADTLSKVNRIGE